MRIKQKIKKDYTSHCVFTNWRCTGPLLISQEMKRMRIHTTANYPAMNFVESLQTEVVHYVYTYSVAGKDTIYTVQYNTKFHRPCNYCSSEGNGERDKAPHSDNTHTYHTHSVRYRERERDFWLTLSSLLNLRNRSWISLFQVLWIERKSSKLVLDMNSSCSMLLSRCRTSEKAGRCVCSFRQQAVCVCVVCSVWEGERERKVIVVKGCLFCNWKVELFTKNQRKTWSLRINSSYYFRLYTTSISTYTCTHVLHM